MRSATSILAVVVFSLATWARAQPVATDVAAAQSLFDAGTRLYDNGNFEQACDKFEASLHLNEEDLDTRGFLALCNEKVGRLATAWSQFRDVRARALRADRSAQLKVAEAHIKALEPRLAKVVVRVEAGANSILVKKDGIRIPPESFGLSVAIDAGVHMFVADEPGYTSWSQTVSIKDGQLVTVEVPKLVAVDPPKTTTVVADRAFEDSRPQLLNTQRWIAVSSGGVGVLALGVSIWAGVEARSSRDDARAHGCNSDLSSCPASALSVANSAYSRGNLSTGFLVGGVALIGAGVVLWFTSPSPTAELTRPSPDETAWRFSTSFDRGRATFFAGRIF